MKCNWSILFLFLACISVLHIHSDITKKFDISSKQLVHESMDRQHSDNRIRIVTAACENVLRCNESFALINSIEAHNPEEFEIIVVADEVCRQIVSQRKGITIFPHEKFTKIPFVNKNSNYLKCAYVTLLTEDSLRIIIILRFLYF